MTDVLAPETLKAFQDDGVAILRGVFADWVDTLREGVDFNMEQPGPDGKVYQQDGGGRFLSDYCNWQRIPQYSEFVTRSPAAAIGAELMQSTTAQLFHEHVLVKEASTGIATPWHQDLPYYCIEGPKTVSLWIPLDEVPRETSPEFIPGSHLWGKLYRPQRFNGQALNENDGLEEIPDIDNHRDDYNILGWAMSPGDAVAFDYRTVHGAPPNNSASTQRRAFSLRLVGDNTRFVRREGIVTSPPFRDVTLRTGDPLSGGDFPVLFPPH